MIPKIIHYCWFGGNPLPESAIKCIHSWRKYFPDYEIKEWNEANYDVNKIAYTKEAYEKKKYAFVSDYARFDILYRYGGVYFDTDVEVIKTFQDILENGSFMGQEAGKACLSYIKSSTDLKSMMQTNENFSEDIPDVGYVVNPGLGIAAEPGLDIYKDIIDSYSVKHFVDKNGVINTTTICMYITEILIKKGYDFNKDEIQTVANIMVYPWEYFCPMNYYTGILTKTEHTHSIHWYSESWFDSCEKMIAKIEKCRAGRNSYEWKIRHFITLPLRIFNKYKKSGIRGVCKAVLSRIK